VSWDRLILGRDPLGKSRWPFLAIGGVVVAVLAGTIGDWTFAALGAAAASLGAVMTYVRYAR